MLSSLRLSLSTSFAALSLLSTMGCASTKPLPAPPLFQSSFFQCAREPLYSTAKTDQEFLLQREAERRAGADCRLVVDAARDLLMQSERRSEGR